jgi:hypothetical protein
MHDIQQSKKMNRIRSEAQRPCLPAHQLLLSVAILARGLTPKVHRIHVASWNQCNACNTVGGDKFKANGNGEEK